jgi:hypothetical protein
MEGLPVSKNVTEVLHALVEQPMTRSFIAQGLYVVITISGGKKIVNFQMTVQSHFGKATLPHHLKEVTIQTSPLILVFQEHLHLIH